MKNFELLVHPDAQAVGITNPVTCLINHVRVTQAGNLLETEIEAVLDIAANHRDFIYESSCYQGFKTLFARLGYPDQVTACDRLINFYASKGFKSINNIVDSYNLCSVLYGSPVGLHDSVGISGDVVIKLATGNEEILPMFKKEPKKIIKDNLIYQTGGRTLCSMGKSDIDADDFKVTETTDSIFIMAIGNEQTTADDNRAICSGIYELVKRSCPQAELQYIKTVLE